MPNEMNGKPPSFAFGVNAPQTPPRRLPRRGGAPRRTPVRSRARVGRSWVSVRSGTRLCASRIVGIAEIGLRRGFRGILSRDRASRRTSSSAMTSSAGAASAFDLLARGILKGGCDLCVRTRRATGCGSRRPVVHVLSERAISRLSFATRKPPDWRDFTLFRRRRKRHMASPSSKKLADASWMMRERITNYVVYLHFTRR